MCVRSKDLNIRTVTLNAFNTQGGTTNTTAAAIMIREEVLTVQGGDRATAPNIVMLLTDGEVTVNDYTSKNDYFREMGLLKRSGFGVSRVF